MKAWLRHWTEPDLSMMVHPKTGRVGEEDNDACFPQVTVSHVGTGFSSPFCSTVMFNIVTNKVAQFKSQATV